jgi:hypothetical protein
MLAHAECPKEEKKRYMQRKQLKAECMLISSGLYPSARKETNLACKRIK